MYDIAEVEAAFRVYWRTGIVAEDWDAWCDLFALDVDYIERVLGTMKGREVVRAWITPLMSSYPEIYGVYDWHMVDAAGRVVFYMQNRRDRPGGGAPIDFPGVSILQYAGSGTWSTQEDYWPLAVGRAAYETYEKLLASEDPGHRQRRTRDDWGSGPAWTRP